MRLKKQRGPMQLKRLLKGFIGLLTITIWSNTATAQSEYRFSIPNDAGGDISLTNLGDFYPGVQGESTYQSLILANGDFLYSVQAIEHDSYDGDFILHRFDGEVRTEVAQLPFQYDFEVGIPRFISQNNKVIFFAWGLEQDFLVFDGATEEISLHSISAQTSQEVGYITPTIFGASNDYAFVGSTYFWGENDGQNIDTIFRLSQGEKIAIELPTDREFPLNHEVNIFSNGIYVKGDKGYILLDHSTSVAELSTPDSLEYLFEWHDKLVLRSESNNIVSVNKRNLELEYFPGHLLGFTSVGGDIKALVKGEERTQLWTFSSNGSIETKTLPLPSQLTNAVIQVNGATGDSLYFVSATENQAGTSYSWWRLNLEKTEFIQLTNLSDNYGLSFYNIENTAFLRAGADLWRSDGSEASTGKVTYPEGVTPFGQTTYQFDESLLMGSYSSMFGREWLVVDKQGNSQVLDIVPGARGAEIYDALGNNILYKDKFYTQLNIPSTGNELYVFSDIASSPSLAYDLTPEAIGHSSMPFSPSIDVLENQKILFVDSLNSDMGSQLFFTDGTPENSGILPDVPNTHYRELGNHYYRKEQLSISRFNQETLSFDTFVTLPERTSSSELLAGQDEWLIYSVYSSDTQQKELIISDGNTLKSIFTSTSNDSYYSIYANGNLYFYHRLGSGYDRWNVYRYNIEADELSQLFEVENLGDFRVISDSELLITRNQQRGLQISKLDEHGELISVFTSPENKHFEAQSASSANQKYYLEGKLLIVEKDLELQPYMNKTGMYLLNLATGEFDSLPISEFLSTQQYSVDYYIYNRMIRATLRNVDNGERRCFIFNQEKLISQSCYSGVEVYDIGEDILILSTRLNSVNGNNYENHVQILDENLNVLFDYQTASSNYPQKRYEIKRKGLLYYVGSEEREELWWKGSKQQAPIKILNDINQLIEDTGLNSLREMQWYYSAVNGRILMRGEIDDIGAEPFALDLFCYPEMQFITPSILEEDENNSMSITPGTTTEVEFETKNMLPFQTEDFQFSDVAGVVVQLIKEDGIFRLELDVANDFTGNEDLSFTVNGECGDITQSINLKVTDKPSSELPSSENTNGGSSSEWIFLLIVVVWLRRIALLKRKITLIIPIERASARH